MTTTLLQQALDALEHPALPVYTTLRKDIRAHLAAQPLHEQLREMGEAHAAQPAPAPKPVPVAWMEPCGTLMYISEVPNPERPTDTAVPLYLHPAAPVPVPLTDEQINAIWNAKDLPEHRSNLTPWGMDRIRAIIAASQDIAASPEVKP
jgi:hypothetical protein